LINQSANHIKSHVKYTRTKKIWFNEPTKKKQYQPVLVHHSAEKMQNAIKSFPALLSHGNQSGQKRKNNSPPGRPEENAVNQSSQEQKPQRTQPKLTRWTNFTSTSTTTTSSSRKESTPQSVGPSAKNHHPCHKAKQTPI
jgi:DNA primase